MAEVPAALAAAVLLVPLALGATALGVLFGVDRKRNDAALPIVCNFGQGNLTSADMRVLQSMAFDAFQMNGFGEASGSMSGLGSMAHLNFTTPETRESGIAHGHISLSLEMKGGGPRVGDGSYIIVDRSEYSKAGNDTIAAFDTISQLLLSGIERPLASLTTVLDAIVGKEH